MGSRKHTHDNTAPMAKDGGGKNIMSWAEKLVSWWRLMEIHAWVQGSLKPETGTYIYLPAGEQILIYRKTRAAVESHNILKFVVVKWQSVKSQNYFAKYHPLDALVQFLIGTIQEALCSHCRLYISLWKSDDAACDHIFSEISKL